MKIPEHFYQNRLYFSQNQWTFEWGTENFENEKVDEKNENFYKNSLCFSQNQWTFEWGLKISKILQKIFKNNSKCSKILRKSSKMIDLPLHLPMNTFLKISSTKKIKKSKFFRKYVKNLRNIPCDVRPFGNPVHTIPQSSRINTVDLILCSNLPQASLIGSFDPRVNVFSCTFASLQTNVILFVDIPF